MKSRFCAALFLSALTTSSCVEQPGPQLLEYDVVDEATTGIDFSSQETRVGYLMKAGPDGEPTVPWRLVNIRPFEEEGLVLIDDDILAPESLVHVVETDEEALTSRQFELASRDTGNAQHFWPNGVLPYVIESDVPNQQRIHDAIAHIEARTSIRFVERTAEKAFVRIKRHDEHCFAGMGHHGGEQVMMLSDGCTMGSVIHEFGHNLGFWHTQSRSDRDQHVTIHWDNIEDAYHYAFETYVEQGYGGDDIGPYETSSIMHYSPTAFSKNGDPTITLRNGRTYTTNRAGLTDNDAASIDFLYGTWNGTFADDDGNTHEASIEKIAAAGVTKGCATGQRPMYCPGAPVTRGQMAVFLTRALKLPAASGDHFDDDDGKYWEDASNRMAESGITSGCGERRYCGTASVTRGQMAVFLNRAFDYPNENRDHFTDDNGRFYEQAAQNLRAAGITQGCGGTKFCGEDPVTRDQMASFLVRALKL